MGIACAPGCRVQSSSFCCPIEQDHADHDGKANDDKKAPDIFKGYSMLHSFVSLSVVKVIWNSEEYGQ